MPREQPLPAIPHEQLAEMRLLDELGDGDPDRGVRIAIDMGDAKFCWLRRELMRGALYPSTIRAAKVDGMQPEAEDRIIWTFAAIEPGLGAAVDTSNKERGHDRSNAA